MGLNGGGCKSVENTEAFGKTGIAKTLKNYAGNANVYYRPFLNPVESPLVLSREFGERGREKVKTSCELYPQVGSMLDDAQEHWFDTHVKNIAAGTFTTENVLGAWLLNRQKETGKIPTFAELKSLRPDLVPEKFVVIAEGMGGMVAREYIQGPTYKGEISNILFFDTPHEGTGFADQALLGGVSGYKVQKKAASTLSAAIPLVLTAYLVGGSDGLNSILTDLLKSIVLGLSENLEGPLQDLQKNFFENYDINGNALWYLTQDADSRDKKYAEAFLQSKINQDELLGSTQYLNAQGKENSEEHPNYNVVYSYGLPSVGNGRRTLEDFGEQFKNHVSDSKIASILKDIQSLKSDGVNLENLPSSTKKIYEILEKFIPEEFRSELFSSAMEFYSSDYAEIVNDVKSLASKGMKINAKNMASYGLNLVDNGRFDVPSYSAFGGNVGIFKDASVNRLGISLTNFNDDSKELQKKFDEIGNLENAREIVDKALSATCSTIEKSGFGTAYAKVCKAAEFATNVALISDISIKSNAVAKKMAKLKSTQYGALQSANENMHSVTPNGYEISYSDLEQMLYGVPHLSLQTVLDRGGAVVPLVLYSHSDNAISLYSDLEKSFGDSTSLKYPVAIKELQKANMKNQSGLQSLTVSGYKTMPAMVVSDFIREMRFVVNDFSPSEMWIIRFDFNSRGEITFERNPSGWQVKMKVGKTEYAPIALSKSPIQHNGLFVFRPDEILSLYEQAGIANVKLSALQEEGPNLVSIFSKNKLGTIGNQQFSFYFQSTRPYMQEGFPKSLEYVANLDSVYIHLSNLGNPYVVKKARAYLLIGGDTLYTSDVGVDTLLSNQGDDLKWEQRWALSAMFKDVAKNKKNADGTYTILWNVTTESTSSGKSEMQYDMRTVVFVDKQAPQITFEIPNENLRNSNEDGFWGAVVNADSVFGNGLKSLKAFTLNGSDTLFLESRNNFDGTALRLHWNNHGKKLSNGEHEIFAEAIDYAGNKTLVSKKIWIDTLAPNFDSENVFYKAAKTEKDTVKVNAETLLGVEFDVHEDLFGRKSENLSVRVYFDDVDSLKSRIFYREAAFDGSLHFSFEEPAAQKLLDGVYRIGVVIQDEAGNVSAKKMLPKILVVDRTPPVVSALMMSAPVYVNTSKVDGGIAYVSQALDNAKNRSALDCYWKVEANGKTVGWNLIGKETKSATSNGNSPYGVNLQNLNGLENGRWVVHFGCYDGAGNFGSNLDVVGVGNRYPSITYPTISLDSAISSENILIEGIAPDPVVPNGNELTAKFKIEWKRVGGEWSEKGVTYLQSMVDSYTRKLALWNRNGLEQGSYALRLTVCNESKGDVVCTNDIQEVYLGDVKRESEFSLSLKSPVNQVAGDSGIVSMAVLGESSADDWILNAQIKVNSPSGGSSKIMAFRYVAENMGVSPFVGVPKEYKNGLNVMQDAEENWIIHWEGPVENLDASIEPHLLLKVQNQGTTFSLLENGAAIDSVLIVPVVKTDFFKMPAYNTVYSWNLKKLKNGLTLKFKADSAFAIDISSVAHGDSLIYCGKNSRPLYGIDPGQALSKIVYVDPKSYGTSFYWNGLIFDGQYPGGGEATLHVIASSKKHRNMVVVDSVSWRLMLPPVRIVTDMKGPGSFVVSRGKDSTETITLGNGSFGFEFGITGQNAKVYAHVQNEAGEVIKTLLNGENYVAGASKNAYMVSWDGTTDNGFVATKVGKYSIKIRAIDSNGNEDELLYDFDLVYAGTLQAAPEQGSEKELPAVLEMKESFMDSTGENRFIGRADYELKADLKANVLPDSEHVFRYYWDMDSDSSYQIPAVYEASRFSLGVRRERQEFEVAIATIVLTKSYNFDWMCEKNESKYKYTIRIFKKKFNRNDDWSLLELAHLDDPAAVTAFEKHGNDKFPILYEVKVFPASEFEQLLIKLNYAYNVSGGVEKDKLTKNGMAFEHLIDVKGFDSNLDNWIDNFGLTKLWSASSGNFYVDSGEMNRSSKETVKNCVISDNDPENFVCGAKVAKNEDISDFNPHADMLEMKLVPDGENGYGSGKYNDWCKSNHGSSHNIAIRSFLRVKDSYWEPAFGYNNLANRYMRFDHSNKILYGNDGYFAKVDTIKNLFDGASLVHSSDYGLVTPFETQYFGMVDVPENPLLFADELNSLKSASRYSAKFFGNTSDEHFEAILLEGGKSKRVYSDGKIVSLDTSFSMNALGFSIRVGSVMEAGKAIKIDVTQPRLTYPLRETVTNLNGLCESADIRNVDRCYKYYEGASRLHYALNDWNDSLWTTTFVNAAGKIRNPVSSQNFRPIQKLNSKFTTDRDDRKNVDSLNVMNDSVGFVWNVPPTLLQKPEIENSRLSVPNTHLVLNLKTNQKNWHIETHGEIVDSVWNAGQLLEESIGYIRLQDSQQNRQAGFEEEILETSLKEQNPLSEIFKESWKKNLEIENIRLLERNSETKHRYFNAENLEGNFGVRISRNQNLPTDVRENEIVTLCGRVPGNNSPWTLSYMKDGKIFSMANGVQPLQDSIYELASFNVNMLQGNTSFFLTYGGASGKVFFKQLDVHIGEKVSPGDSTLVSSMYGNVRVQFVPGSYDSDVDVTVRTAALQDYNSSTFAGVEPVGAIIEVLPSHIFPEDRQKWPRVQVDIRRENLNSKDPRNVKIFKLNFETRQLVPLEVIEKAYLDNSGKSYDALDSKWTHVLVSGVTGTFSTFVALDSAYADSLNMDLVKEPEEEPFVCGNVLIDTLWAGVANGYLEFPNPCTGKNNYLLQLRKGQNIVAEKQGIARGNVQWNVRPKDIQSFAESYESRLAVFGPENETRQFGVPEILIDSTVPQINELNIEVQEKGTSKLIEVNAFLDDFDSGIESAQIDVYFAGSILETRNVLQGNYIAENFEIKKELLEECIGCKVSVAVTAWDHGHNFAKQTLESDALYPYPVSIVLWYPLSDGVGAIAKEMTKTHLDLALSKMENPWYYGNQLYLRNSKDVASSNASWNGVGEVPLSIDFVLKSFAQNGGTDISVLGWNGTLPWMLGIAKDGHLFFETESERVWFNVVPDMARETHYALVVDGSKATLYKDGGIADTRNLKVPFVWNSKGKPVIGSFKELNSFNGTISDLRFYKKALDQEQVAALYRIFLNLDENGYVVARAASLQFENMWVDQSCEVAGNAYLRQNSNATGIVQWNAPVSAGKYYMYLLSRGKKGGVNGVEVFVDGHSEGIFEIPSNGIWTKTKLMGLQLSLTPDSEISIRPLQNTGVAGLALVPFEKEIVADLIRFEDSSWKQPEPKVSVEMMYGSPNDMTWTRPQFRIQNLTGSSIEGARLRYYYKGEGEKVQAVSFYPSTPMSVEPDAGSVYFGELKLTEAISPYGSAYWNNGPQIGLHRNDMYFPWYTNDDPSYNDSANTGRFVKTQSVAILDSCGNLLNAWSCYAVDGPAEAKTLQVRAMAKNTKVGSNQSSLVSMYVENVGTVPIDSFEVRYYLRDNSQKLAYDVYYSPFAAYSQEDVGGDLKYVSFRYHSILNPGEKSDFGSGVNFELRHSDWASDFEPGDDPSGYNLSETFIEADSVVILDVNGNLLWGGVPKPQFVDETFENELDVNVSREDATLYIQVGEAGEYSLEIVNSVGTPLQTLFKGRWNEGVHSVELSREGLKPGSYMVLRKDSKILSWNLLN